jgi:hypothetical protein
MLAYGPAFRRADGAGEVEIITVNSGDATK